MPVIPSKSGWLALIAAVALFAGPAAQALEPTTSLASYGRQGWATENGLPQNTVQALAQTRDGFVWLGTEVGLVRFDGNGFTVFDQNSKPALPGNDVQCLLAAMDGSLWVGTSDGLALIKEGVVTPLTTANGLPGNNVRNVVQASNGVIWAWTNQGIARYDHGRFLDETAATRLPGGAITRVSSDGRGEVWVGTQDEVALYRGGRWTPPTRQLGTFPWTPSGPIQFVQSFSVGKATRVASADNTTVAMQGSDNPRGDNVVWRFSTGNQLPGTRLQALYADREGALWIGTNGGLVRFADGKLEKLPVTDSLASASILTLMEDREGDLWVGTEQGGLQILRDERFRTLTTRDGLASDNTTAITQDGAGTLWVGTAGSGLTALRPGASGSAKTYDVQDGLISNVILSLTAAPNGDLWAGTPDGLSRIRGGKVDSFTSADGLPDDFVRSLLADRDGSLWVGTRRGLVHWSEPGSLRDGTMQTFTTANGLGSNLVGAMDRDSNGDLWVATFAGLSRVHAGRIENYTTKDGLSSNVVTALLPRSYGTLLIGTQDRGWNLWDGKRFMAVKQHGLDQTSVHAILDDGNNHLWFATGQGLARCDCGEAMGPMQGADCAHWLEFGTADGLHSRDTSTNSHPSAWRAQSGHLWFTTPKGIVEVDPAHFPVNTVPPPVVVEHFAVDDVDALDGANSFVRVPPGKNHLQFEYAGLSFVAPQKVRYRYMLEGFDKTWTEAGPRRTAYYTNIPPGRYTFRVQAANNDGMWNTQGTELKIQLLPHFYQTVWFYLLVVLGLAGLLILALRLRLRRAEREFKAVLGERNRIAREIHDTLAQGYVGISVQLEVLSELLRHKKVDAAAKHLNTTRGYVREGLADARQSIWALRSQDSEETTLPVRLRRIVEQAAGHGLETQFSIYGAYRSLPPGTEREILRIAQEAIHNVKKHAGATMMTVQLEYQRSEIALEVRDDGGGFTSNGKLESPPGHYGLTGMRERAAAIGGALEVTSEPGAGTTVRMRASTPKGSHVSREPGVPKEPGISKEPKE